MKSCVIPVAVLILGALLSAQKPVERPETILVNGKILAADSTFTIYEALAIRGDRITAAGSTKDIRALADAKTRVIDLGGRTVIPGMTDSHMHAIRAGLTFATEVHWIGAPTIENAIGRLRDASKRLPPGSWLIVAGGWTERQFKEDRRPTQSEIAAAAPDRHVYVQQLYSRVLLDPGGYDALGIARDPGLAARVTVERDAEGKATGWLSGDNRAISD